MDIESKIHTKLKKILKKLKSLGIIDKYKLEINFCQVEENLKRILVEIDSVLKKCLRKIINKPRKAEIRNVISELVRKKNLSDMEISQDPVQGDLLDKESCFHKPENQNTCNTFKFHCNFCEKIFNSKKEFIIHKKSHKHFKNFLCDKCGLLFINLKKWQKHLMECNEPPEWSLTLRYFPNYLNNKIFTSGNSDLHILSEKLVESKVISEKLVLDSVAMKEIRHSIPVNNLENQEPEETKKFDCFCGKSFRILKSLQKHEKLKHSLMNIKYNCSACEKTFMEKGKLNRHMLTHKKSQHKCSFCSKHFSRSDTLKRHMSLFHCNSKEFFCRYCQKIFKLKFNRDIHEENTHKNISNQIQCQHCGGKFKSKVTLKSHLKVHFGNKITCSPCCKSFTRKSYYKKHVKNKHFGVNPSHKILEGDPVDDPLNVHPTRAFAH